MGAAARAVAGLLEDLRNRGLGAVDCTASTSRYNHGSDASLDDRDAQSWLLLLRPITINGTNKRVLWKNSGTQGVQMQQGPFGGTQGRFNYTRSRATTNTTATAPNDTLIADKYQWLGITDQDGIAPQILHALLGRWLEPLASYATQTTGVGAPLTEASVNLFVGSRDSANTESDCHIAALWGYRRRLTKPEFWLHQLAPWCNLGDDCFLHVLYGLGPGRAIDWSGRGNHGTPEGTVPPLRRGPDILAPSRRRLFARVGLTPVAATELVGYESLGAIAQTQLGAYEALLGLAQTGVLPFEAAGQVAASLAAVFEALQALESGQVLGYELTQGIAGTAPLPLEALAGIAGTALVPYEAGGQVSAAIVAPFEALVQLAATSALPAESLEQLAAGQAVAFETLSGVAVAVPIPLESEGTIAPGRYVIVGTPRGTSIAGAARRTVTGAPRRRDVAS